MTQDQAFSEFIPYINDVGKIYRKISPVFARLANVGEYIEKKDWKLAYDFVKSIFMIHVLC